MSSDMTVWREEVEKTVLTVLKAVKSISQVHIELTSRVNILEEQMKRRIYVSPAHKNLLQKAVNNHVRALTEQYALVYKQVSKILFQAIWRALKDKYSISVYSELPDIEFDNALDFIRTWENEVLLNRLQTESAA